jgi:uncharacterized integral membrane protein
MRKFLTAVVLIPLGLIFIAFAVANRHFVTVSFDPFNSRDPSVGATLPLFVVIIAVAIAGVIVGGAATWLRQARAQLADLRASVTRGNPQQLPALLQPNGGYGVTRRDKQSVTL